MPSLQEKDVVNEFDKDNVLCLNQNTISGAKKEFVFTDYIKLMAENTVLKSLKSR